MAGVGGLNPPELKIWRAWRPDDQLRALVRMSFGYEPRGSDRATGYFLGEEHQWPPALAGAGPVLLDDLHRLTGVRFPIVAFQAYRRGSGCGWHSDTPFGAQAILSLGATRTFEIRQAGQAAGYAIEVAHGDLVFMPAGYQQSWEHRIPDELDITGERCSLVFRTRRTDGSQ